MQLRYSLPESNMSQPRRGCRFSPAPAHDTVSALGRRWPDRLNGIPMTVNGQNKIGSSWKIRLLVCSVLASRCPAYESEDQDDWSTGLSKSSIEMVSKQERKGGLALEEING